MVSAAQAQDDEVRFPRLERAVRILVLIAFPASLASPGITIPMALTGLIGLYFWSRRGAMPSDLVAPARVTLALYLTVLLVDVVNGRPLLSIVTTGVNYLPLLAMTPFAMALREAEVPWHWVDTAIKATIALAAVSSVIQFIGGDKRPEGLNLNAIPYGLVVLFWMMFVLARFLGHRDRMGLAFAVIATVPIILTSSKNVLACMILGVALMLIYRLVIARDWKTILPATAVFAVALALASVTFMRERIAALVTGYAQFLTDGNAGLRSFDDRYRINIAAKEAFWDSPLIGHGLHESLGAVMGLVEPYHKRYDKFGHLHGDYITHGVAFGVPGLIFIGGFLAFLLWVALRCKDEALRVFGLGFATAVALYMVFDIAFNMDPLSGAIAVVVGLILAYGSRARA